LYELKASIWVAVRAPTPDVKFEFSSPEPCAENVVCALGHVFTDASGPGLLTVASPPSVVPPPEPPLLEPPLLEPLLDPSLLPAPSVDAVVPSPAGPSEKLTAPSLMTAPSGAIRPSETSVGSSTVLVGA
jgi:hypothetical protein